MNMHATSAIGSSALTRRRREGRERESQPIKREGKKASRVAAAAGKERLQSGVARFWPGSTSPWRQNVPNLNTLGAMAVQITVPKSCFLFSITV